MKTALLAATAALALGAASTANANPIKQMAGPLNKGGSEIMATGDTVTETVNPIVVAMGGGAEIGAAGGSVIEGVLCLLLGCTKY